MMLDIFWGQDHFSYALNQEHNSSTIIQNLDEKNRQFGARANYNKIWKGKGSSNLTISYSALQRDAIDQQSSALSGSGSGGGMGSGGMGSGGSGDGMGMREKELHSQNDISELKMMITGVHRLFKKHQLEYGSGLIHNSSYLQELTVSTTLIDFKEQGSQWVNYLQDRFSPNKYFNLRFGLHHNYAQNIKKSLESDSNLKEFRNKYVITNVETNDSGILKDIDTVNDYIKLKTERKED